MQTKLPDFRKIGQDLIKDAQTIAEVEMINFVLGNFEKQGFTDSGFTPWEGRKDGADPGRAVLVKSGHLRDSVEVTESSPVRVVVSAGAEYAEIHNEGGTVNVPISKKMRGFFWFMYKKTQEGKWKGMALTKKTHFAIQIPKRQFMGGSQSFNQQLEGLIFQAVESRFKQHLNNK